MKVGSYGSGCQYLEGDGSRNQTSKLLRHVVLVGALLMSNIDVVQENLQPFLLLATTQAAPQPPSEVGLLGELSLDAA